MTYIIEIPDNCRCRDCPVVVEFMNILYCPVRQAEVLHASHCTAMLDTDESFVKEHDLYTDLLEEVDELRSKDEA